MLAVYSMIERDKVWMEKSRKSENVKKFKMNFVTISILLLLIGHGTAREVCPRMCLCDVFEGYKRADCR